MSHPRTTLHISDRADADALIRDIRRAVRNSARTGGGYGVYRRDAAGDYPVAIEVNIVPRSGATHSNQRSAKTQPGKGLPWNRLSLFSS